MTSGVRATASGELSTAKLLARWRDSSWRYVDQPGEQHALERSLPRVVIYGLVPLSMSHHGLST